MTTPASDSIQILGARQHNLKNVSLELPHGRLTVITGVSGSGKSSLAFDTIYAEGQRRYVESVSTYAKQFLERLPRPDVDAIYGLSPAVAIQPASPARSARSTVGTATEIYDYLRLLFARLGQVHCLKCGRPIVPHSTASIAEESATWRAGETVLVLAPVQRSASVTWPQQARALVASGFTRLWRAGAIVELDPLPKLPAKEQAIRVVADRIRWSADERSRLVESCELAFRRGEGRLELVVGDAAPQLRSERWECPSCGTPALRPEPALFSFNSPLGVCPTCRGFGDVLVFDPDLIVPDPDRTLRQGAIAPWAGSWRRVFAPRLEKLAKEEGFSLDVPWKRLASAHQKLLLQGGGSFRGAMPFLERRQQKSYKAGNRFLVKRYQRARRCETCDGRRLRREALVVTLGGQDIASVAALNAAAALGFAEALPLDERQREIAAHVLDEITSRLRYMVRVGLGYLSLDRLTRTLSGGEAQRIELANALGSNLADVLYVLDEPTVGLHARDSRRLAGILRDLTTRGNTLVVVEHEPLLMREADYLVDLGPGAGDRGGEVLFAGPGGDVGAAATTTGQYLRGEKQVARTRVTGTPRHWITVEGATHHNLRDVTARFPLERLTCVTGVSGSGKSSLVEEILYRGVAAATGAADEEPVGAHRRIGGTDRLKRAALVDRTPIGRTPRSCPVSYVGAYAHLRRVFAEQWSAKAKGLTETEFSFNVAGGRCERCEGAGVVKVEMHFLADVLVPCDECGGDRFQRRVLDVGVRGVNIREALDLTVDQAFEHFAKFPRFTRALHILRRVGLGYLRLGQPATHLSGGEAQRLKIARELGESGVGPTLYVLDEPTVGLHFSDVQKLLEVLDELVQRGDSVVVVEHNLDVIRNADHVIDLGPEGGEEGGRLVAEGTPEQIAAVAESWTGRHLAEALAPAEKRD